MDLYQLTVTLASYQVQHQANMHRQSNEVRLDVSFIKQKYTIFPAYKIPLTQMMRMRKCTG